MRKPLVYAVAMVAVAGAGALTVWGIRHAVGTPKWQAKLAELEPLVPSPGAPPWYVASLARLDALYHGHREWTEADADEIVAMIELGRTVAVMPTTLATDDGHKWYLAVMAGAAAGHRLVISAPASSGAVKRIERAFLEGLKSPAPFHRSESIVCLVESGIARDPALRHHVEEMQHDPDPKVASMARLKYGQLMDNIESDRVRGKLPKGW